MSRESEGGSDPVKSGPRPDLAAGLALGSLPSAQADSSHGLDRESILRRAGRNLHFYLTALMWAAVIPIFLALHRPLQIDWAFFAGAYWVGMLARSVFLATILYVMGFPVRETLLPLWEHYRHQKARFIFLGIFTVAMLWVFGWVIGTMVIVDGIAILELADRTHLEFDRLGDFGRRIFTPAAYFFVALVVMFVYNHIIACVEYAGAEDLLHLKVDALLFFGASVPHLVHAALASLPLQLFQILDFAYFSLFAQVGATLVLTAFCLGKDAAFRYVGAIMTAYYIALAMSYLWPGIGPYAVCGQHFSVFPRSLEAYSTQAVIIAKAKLLAAHQSIPGADLIHGADYHISFPCMHLAMPLISLWFVRKWKRITMILLAYDLVLANAILLLEWHYLFDMVGGVAVAVIAIALTSPARAASVGEPSEVAARKT